MRNKSWPFWETWTVIFGKDRASGGGVKDVDGSADRARSQMPSGSQVNENDYRPSTDDIPISANDPLVDPQDPLDENLGNSGQQPSTIKTSSLKCKAEGSDAALMEFLGHLHSETNARLELISSRIGYEFDMGQARQAVFDKLGVVEGLTLEQRYNLCDILGDKP